MRVLTRPNLGGPTQQAIALWHAMELAGIATLLVTGAVGGDEAMLSPADAGVPGLTLPEALAAGTAARGWVVVPELRRGIAPWRDRRAAAALRALARAFAPDVVHTHTSKAGWLGRRAARAAGGAVIVHTFHGHVLQDYFARPVAALWRWLERRAAARTDVLIAVSASCADELAAAGVAARDRFVVVPPAVALPPLLDRDAARARLGVPAAERRIAAVGRLVPVKRLEHFVELLAHLPGVAGDVVGAGPEASLLQPLAERLVPGRVRFRGARPGIAAELAAYDVLVLPSVREGLPLVAVEAFAAGVPVVGYDVAGVRDVLACGRGHLVPPAAGPRGLAAAVAAVLDPPGAAAGGGGVQARGATAAAVRDFVAACAPAAVAARLAGIYRDAQARRAGLP